MRAYWDVEILTTRALNYTTWADWYPEGIERIGGVPVRRFSVDQPRDPIEFDRLSGNIHANGTSASVQDQEAWMRSQGPLSSDLLQFIEENEDVYDWFLFFGYLYATTYFGLPQARDKAWLAPLGHDEWPIHLTMWDALFAQARGFVFQTEEEKQFLQRRFANLRLAGPVIGIGISEQEPIETTSFRTKYDLPDQFLLYVGRIEAAKGCEQLFEFFLRLRHEGGEKWKLVLIGQEIMSVPFDDGIIHLGFVDEAEKWQAMAACDWLVVPSPHESLSIALLECWSVGRPALVNGSSEVLVGHCRRANGGLWYNTYQEWRAALLQLDGATKTALGLQGKQYVEHNYSWDRVEAAFLKLFPSSERGTHDVRQDCSEPLAH